MDEKNHIESLYSCDGIQNSVWELFYTEIAKATFLNDKADVK